MVIKRLECGVDHPLLSVAEDKYIIIVPLLPLWAFMSCFGVNGTFFHFYTSLMSNAVAHWLRRCATNRKVAGSIPAGAIGIFH